MYLKSHFDKHLNRKQLKLLGELWWFTHVDSLSQYIHGEDVPFQKKHSNRKYLFQLKQVYWILKYYKWSTHWFYRVVLWSNIYRVIKKYITAFYVLNVFCSKGIHYHYRTMMHPCSASEQWNYNFELKLRILFNVIIKAKKIRRYVR